jgi:hypothetical protein
MVCDTIQMVLALYTAVDKFSEQTVINIYPEAQLRRQWCYSPYRRKQSDMSNR